MQLWELSYTYWASLFLSEEVMGLLFTERALLLDLPLLILPILWILPKDACISSWVRTTKPVPTGTWGSHGWVGPSMLSKSAFPPKNFLPTDWPWSDLAASTFVTSSRQPRFAKKETEIFSTYQQMKKQQTQATLTCGNILSFQAAVPPPADVSAAKNKSTSKAKTQQQPVPVQFRPQQDDSWPTAASVLPKLTAAVAGNCILAVVVYVSLWY